MSSKKIVFMIVKTVCSIILLMLIFSFVYSMCSKAYDFGFRIFAEDPVSPAPGHTVSVAIVEGKSVMEIGEILNSKEILNSSILRNSALIIMEGCSPVYMSSAPQ